MPNVNYAWQTTWAKAQTEQLKDKALPALFQGQPNAVALEKERRFAKAHRQENTDWRETDLLKCSPPASNSVRTKNPLKI